MFLNFSRPVKIIRLIGRDTIEEIIYQRAASKLRLTNAIVEGGQFALGAPKPQGAAELQVKLSYILNLILIMSLEMFRSVSVFMPDMNLAKHLSFGEMCIDMSAFACLRNQNDIPGPGKIYCFDTVFTILGCICR